MAMVSEGILINRDKIDKGTPEEKLIPIIENASNEQIRRAILGTVCSGL